MSESSGGGALLPGNDGRRKGHWVQDRGSAVGQDEAGRPRNLPQGDSVDPSLTPVGDQPHPRLATPVLDVEPARGGWIVPIVLGGVIVVTTLIVTIKARTAP